MLTVTANVVKNNLSEDELMLLLEEMSGPPAATKNEMMTVYQAFLERSRQANSAYEEPQAALSYPS